MSRHWPLNERPCERLITQGPAALTESELLAILWGHGVRDRSVIDLARALLQEYGTLSALYDAPYHQAKHHPGFGVNKYCQLQAALELSRRHYHASLHRPITMTNRQKVNEFFLVHLRNPAQEIFAALFLDCKHRLIQFEKLFFGSINNATVHPRIVVQRALAHNASAVIIAHNHPSGIAKPSQADKEITRNLQQILALVEIELLDHIIVGANTFVSVEV